MVVYSQTRLTSLLKEMDFQVLANKNLPRTFFTDVLDSSFWIIINPGLLVQTQARRITKDDMLLLPNVYDSFVSDDVRAEVIALRADLKMRQKPSIKACSMRSGDSVDSGGQRWTLVDIPRFAAFWQRRFCRLRISSYHCSRK